MDKKHILYAIEECESMIMALQGRLEKLKRMISVDNVSEKRQKLLKKADKVREDALRLAEVNRRRKT